MTREEIQAAAAALDEAERKRSQIGLLSRAHPEMSMDDAYAVQAAWVQKKLAGGRRVIGRKIGLTSKAMQAALSIDIPDSGILFDDMLFENDAAIPGDRFIQPRIEAEIAFVMKSDLKGDVGIDQVLDATHYVQPSLEILDTRIVRMDSETGATRNVCDTIADNAANAGIVLGGEKIGPRAVDLRWIGAIVMKNGKVEETGLGGGVLNHPAEGIVWLVRRLAEYGDFIRAGEIVLSGSFIRPVEARPGDAIVADFGGHGCVSCQF